jgi:hypothetical protein
MMDNSPSLGAQNPTNFRKRQLLAPSTHKRVVHYVANVDLGDAHAFDTLTAPWTKAGPHLRRALLNPISRRGHTRTIEGEECDCLRVRTPFGSV